MSAEAREVDFPWYALCVYSKAERRASHALREAGYREFAPFYRARRRWSDRNKLVELPFFPGYVFCRFNPDNRVPVLRIPGVVGIVRFGQQFIPVEESEIAAIMEVATSGAEVVPWPYLRVGQRVRVCGGALRGLEGFLLGTRGDRRLVLSVTLMQRSVAVDIHRAEVEPVL